MAVPRSGSPSQSAPPSRVYPPPRPYPSTAFPPRPRRSRWSSSPFFRVGLPFLAFLSLGSFFLSSFLSDQYERQRRDQKWEGAESDLMTAATRRADPALKGTGQRPPRQPKEFDLEEEYRRSVGSLSLDFENVRVPRPQEIAERTKRRAAERARAERRQPPPLESAHSPSGERAAHGESIP